MIDGERLKGVRFIKDLLFFVNGCFRRRYDFVRAFKTLITECQLLDNSIIKTRTYG